MTLYHCNVTYAGINKDGVVIIDLYEWNGQFSTPTRFLAPENVKKEMLAIALVAFTTGTLVQADIDNIADWDLINCLALEQG